MVGEINDGKRQLHSVAIVPNKLNPVVPLRNGNIIMGCMNGWKGWRSGVRVGGGLAALARVVCATSLSRI